MPVYVLSFVFVLILGQKSKINKKKLYFFIDTEIQETKDEKVK